MSFSLPHSLTFCFVLSLFSFPFYLSRERDKTSTPTSQKKKLTNKRKMICACAEIYLIIIHAKTFFRGTIQSIFNGAEELIPTGIK